MAVYRASVSPAEFSQLKTAVEEFDPELTPQLLGHATTDTDVYSLIVVVQGKRRMILNVWGDTTAMMKHGPIGTQELRNRIESFLKVKRIWVKEKDDQSFMQPPAYY
jgi:hypothetical protein